MLTELETKVMKTIPKNDFYENGFNSILWNDSFLDTVNEIEGIDQKQARAILVSLKKKDFIILDGGKDGGLSLTDIGQKWLIENNITNEKGYLIK